MARLPKLPDPNNLFSVIDKAGSVIDKGLDPETIKALVEKTKEITEE